MIAGLRFLAWAAFAWAMANIAYVYFALGGQRAYRIETALLILAVAVASEMVARRAAVASTPPGSRAALVIAVAALILWAVPVLPLLGFPFLSDDYVFLGLVHAGGSISSATMFFRPVFAGVFRVVAVAGGESVAPFHVLSFALHLGSAALVFVLARRWFGAVAPASVSFAVFLLNPLQLEPVLWVSGLQELLWSFFVLAALVCYTGAQTLSLARLAGTLGLVALALLSKETAVCAFPLLAAADWVLFGFARGRMTVPAYAAGAVLVLAFVAVRLSMGGEDPSFLVAPDRYFLKELLVTPYRVLVHPWNASAVAVPLAVSGALTLAAVALAFFGIRRGAGCEVVIGAFIIAVSTVPVYSYFFVDADLRHARYLYFAAAGWSVLVAGLVRVWPPRIAMAIVSLYLVAAASLLALNQRPWLIARDVIAVLAQDAAAGPIPGPNLQSWLARSGIVLPTDNGIPTEYHGAWILLNGHSEFVEYARRK